MKQLYLLLFFLSTNCFSQNEFITIWDTNLLNQSNSIYLNVTENDSLYYYSFQKLDSELNIISGYSEETVVPINNGGFELYFPEAGKYRLKIHSNSSNFSFGGNFKLIRVEQWGNIIWSTFANAFAGCVNLDITATDIPNLENVTSTSNMFYNCNNLIYNPSINSWNTQNIENFELMFALANNFNQPIGNWNMSNATTLELMFMGANSFNQPIEEWIVENVTNFYGTFHYNHAFNQPLNKWNVSNGTDLEHLFCGAIKFNQPLFLWDVSDAPKMEWIFNGAAKFNQDLSDWKLDSIETGKNFFSHSGMDCNNFTNTMLSWSENTNLAEDIIFGIAEMKYSSDLTPTLNWFTNSKLWNFEGIAYEYENCTLNTTFFEKASIKTYPNPSSNIINIEGVEVEKIDIYDTKGSLIQKTLNNNQIDVSNLSSGNYILIINDQYKENIIKK